MQGKEEGTKPVCGKDKERRGGTNRERNWQMIEGRKIGKERERLSLSSRNLSQSKNRNE